MKDGFRLNWKPRARVSVLVGGRKGYIEPRGMEYEQETWFYMVWNSSREPFVAVVVLWRG